MKRFLSIFLTLSVLLTVMMFTISAEAATTLAVSPTSATIEKGSTKTLTIKINGKNAAASKCSYSTSSKTIATVSSKGVITAKKAGTATITVKLKSNSKVKKTCKVKVIPKMTLSATSKSMYVGRVEQLTVKLDGKAYAAKNCYFTSSNTGVATVSTGGYITAKKAGTATITVKSKSNSAVKKTCKVTVKANTIKTDATALTFSKGGTKTMKVVLNGANAGGGSLNYKSSNTGVATVSTSGVITAKAAGTATITASAKLDATCKATLKVTVLDGNDFTITTSALPLNGKYMNFGNYDNTTKQWYVLKSYMDVLETLGGGSLTISSGTYNIYGAVYVPSNVKVYLNDGVTLNKTSGSGTMFMLCAPSKSETANAYSGYNGVHDVDFVAKGNATIDMKGAPKTTSAAFVLCHNQNINIEGIRFNNLSSVGHYFELDASKNISFNNCSFENEQKGNLRDFDECVNLDIPDKNTGGINQPWITYDNTPNNTITFDSCSFKNVQSGIGTHTYTDKKYHSNITITNCSFENCLKCAINPKNWQNATISNNTFDGVGMDSSAIPYTEYQGSYNLETDSYAIYCAGSDAMTIEGNTFKNMYNAMWFNAATSKFYPKTYNKMTTNDYFAFVDNNNLYGDTILNYYINAMYVEGYIDEDGTEHYISPVRFYGDYIPYNGINYSYQEPDDDNENPNPDEKDDGDGEETSETQD